MLVKEATEVEKESKEVRKKVRKKRKVSKKKKISNLFSINKRKKEKKKERKSDRISHFFVSTNTQNLRQKPQTDRLNNKHEGMYFYDSL